MVLARKGASNAELADRMRAPLPVRSLTGGGSVCLDPRKERFLSHGLPHDAQPPSGCSHVCPDGAEAGHFPQQ